MRSNEGSTNITDTLAEALRLAMDWNWLDEDARPSDIAIKCDAALAKYDAAEIIDARMPSVTFRPITDEDIDAIGSALYIYWFDVKERARDKYRKKVCGALKSILPHGMPVVGSVE